MTGSAGRIGRWQVEALRNAGYDVRTFDRAAQGKEKSKGEHFPGDLRDISAVRQAVQGMDAVLHLGALSSDRAGPAEDVLTINVQGTWNVLLACVEAGVERLVYFSSVNALGCVGGHRAAGYLPIDDAYPRHPLSPYQLSKHLSEEACRSFSDRHGLVTVCLRPVFVTDPAHYDRWRAPRQQGSSEWAKVEYWAYVDVRDVCDAALLGLTAENVTHDAFLLTADDTTQETPTAELVDRYYPDTPWKPAPPAQGKQDPTPKAQRQTPNARSGALLSPQAEPEAYRAARDIYLAANPHRSLMDCSHAKQVLGWQPRHSWRATAQPEETP